MADEKKPGLLKRMFSFGFGKKKNAEPEVDEAEAQAAEQEAAAAEEAARLQAEAKLKQEAEEAARLEAEEAEAEAERLRAEQEEAAKEAQRLADQQAKAEAEKLAAEAKEAEAAEKTKAEEEAKRLEREAEEALKVAQAKEQQEREEEARKERARLEEVKREREAQEAEERLKAEREAAEELAAQEAEDKKARAEEEAQRLAAEEAEAERIAEQEREAEQAKVEAERLEAEQAALEEEAETEQQLEPEPVDAPEDEQEAERKVGWFKRLTKGLAKSSSSLKENITSVFTKKKLDEETLQDLEDILIQADLGVETSMNITDALAAQRMGKDVTDEEVREVMAAEIEKVLEPVAQPLELDLDHQPHVILVVGVNGSGKTTTIGKISQKLYNAGFSTLLVAGDTFRAAAVEQLHIWGDRTQAPVMSRGNGADAAGLAFDAYDEAVAQKKDVMLMDTAGRLQNKKELMDELEKIIRVLKKQDETAPHTVLLTLDATTGQNALNQVEIFKDVAGVNGLVMTKLDGTARGGILVSISAKHKLPVYFIGVGEQVEDLEPFEADVFAKAIAGIE